MNPMDLPQEIRDLSNVDPIIRNVLTQGILKKWSTIKTLVNMVVTLEKDRSTTLKRFQDILERWSPSLFIVRKNEHEVEVLPTMLGARRSGKTRYLVTCADKRNGYIVVRDRRHVDYVARMAQDMRCNINFSLTHEEILSGDFHPVNCSPLHIDDADELLKKFLNRTTRGAAIATVIYGVEDTTVIPGMEEAEPNPGWDEYVKATS